MQEMFGRMLSILPILNIQCLNYIFRRTNILDEVENWESDVSPCENDQIDFDNEEITTVLIASGLHSRKINFPNNGILYFGEMMELGKLGGWQCGRRKNVEGGISFCFNEIKRIALLID